MSQFFSSKYWSFSFSISPSNEQSGLISLRIDWLDLLQSKGLSGVSSNTTVQKLFAQKNEKMTAILKAR